MFCLLVTLCSLFSAELHYDSQLEGTVRCLMKCPESRKIIEAALTGGSINVVTSRSTPQQFEAMWESDSRTISINLARSRSSADTIASILFELHNATSDQQLRDLFFQAYRGKLSKWEYVRGVEKMEHQNGVSTSAIISEGIRKGYFPPNSRWYVHTNFDEYFRYQYQAGHSKWIAENYDQMQTLRRSNMRRARRR